MAAAAAAPAAAAHEVRGAISPAGLDFIAEQVPDYVPARLSPPPITLDLVDCPGSRVVQLTQRDTDIDLAVDDVSIGAVDGGVLRVVIQFDAFAAGEAYVLYPYACFGSATCRDELTILDGRAAIDFAPSVDADGRPQVAVAGVDLWVGEDDVDFALSDCAIDDVVNWVIGAAKGWLLDALVGQLEQVARDQLEPMMQDVVGGFLQFDGTLAIADFSFAATELSAGDTGVALRGDVSLSSRFPADACIAADPGAPGPHAGASPDPSAGTPAHVGVAVNLGLVDDVLYQVWRNGLMCLTPEHLAALGLDLDLEAQAALLPGFPPGSDIDIELRMGRPPRVEGRAGGGAVLDLIVEDVDIDITATPAGGGEPVALHARAGATAEATLDIDPAINALTLRVDAVDITRLEIDEDYAATTGLDAAQLVAVAEGVLIPGLLDQLGDQALTGPIFGVADYYLILRDVDTTDAYAIAKLDLFRKPAADSIAPDTRIVSAPVGVVRPEDAVVRVGGSDDQIPPELLRYRFSIDGASRAPTYVAEIAVGEAGVSGTYRVAAAAIDLHDNEDATPAEAIVEVDGVRPRVRLAGDAVIELPADATAVDVAWTATDDRTPAEALAPRVELLRVIDPTDLATAEPVGAADLEPGTRSVRLPVTAGERYRVIVTVRDEVGNAAYASALVRVAGEPGACGCRAGGDPAGAAPVWLALVAVALGRRRRR
ncbi:MAG: hypothetical protein D6689_16415 [Deltaproteobacteria bacterium]|nr:MAG: hypothetical protein D6689_16415 [Deltaproteobacteria bacterium]